MMVTESSLFWHHLAVDAPAGSGIHAQIIGLPTSAAVITTSSAWLPVDTLTADTLQWMSAYSPASVSNREAVANNGTYYKTSWLGFRLDKTICSPLVAFMVQSVFTTVSIAANSPITFNQVVVNEGSAWNSATNTFTVPVAGAYFIVWEICIIMHI